jgi:phosphoenolpyruvate carboxykinase (ATP)
MTNTGAVVADLADRTQANLGVPALYEAAIRRSEGQIADGGPLVVRTGAHNARSPEDRFIVDEPSSTANVWWGPTTKRMSEAEYDALRGRIVEYLGSQGEVFAQDCFVGADPVHRRSLRIVTESAWQSLFAEAIFIRPTQFDLEHFHPEFRVFSAPGLSVEPPRDGTRTGMFVAIHLGRREVLIAGTGYAGEMKKAIFTMMSYFLPDEGVLPMHCSASVGRRGDVSVFFGLSGTGKTSLATDPERTLIGDDEHGWGDHGLFNLEGGCYAKVINLSPTAEPDIWGTTRRFGTLLENVAYEPSTRELDLDSDAITENTRATYPLSAIRNASDTGLSGHPVNVVLLTADAFGVLPPISRITPEQALYHYLSGYSARIVRTEVSGEPSAAFSACFAAPFFLRHAGVYARMLGERIARHHARVWLVNTGWTGGPYGVGSRIRIAYTRAMVHAALDGRLNGVSMEADPVFGVMIPTGCPGVPPELLRPRDTWASKPSYDAQARRLAHMFARNFAAFADGVAPEIRAAGPRVDQDPSR